MAFIDIIRNMLLAGFGAQEKLKEFMDELVKKGELSESQAAKLVKEWSEKIEKNTEDISRSLNEVVSMTLEKMRFASQEDISKINEKIDALSERVVRVEGSPFIKEDLIKLSEKIDLLALKISKLEETKGA